MEKVFGYYTAYRTQIPMWIDCMDQICALKVNRSFNDYKGPYKIDGAQVIILNFLVAHFVSLLTATTSSISSLLILWSCKEHTARWHCSVCIVSKGTLHGSLVSKCRLHGDIVSKCTLHGDIVSKDTLHGDIVSKDTLHGDIVSKGTLHGDIVLKAHCMVTLIQRAHCMVTLIQRAHCMVTLFQRAHCMVTLC